MAPRDTYISRQARRLSSGQIDRRRFVMQALATGVSMPTAVSLATRAEAARPRAGGTLHHGVSSQTRLHAVLLNTCRDRLVEVASNGNVVAGLAESFEPEDNARRWIFDLRKGVTFHSGRELTADDAVWTLDVARRSGIATGTEHLVDRVRALDTHRIEVLLTHAHWDFPRLLAAPALSIRPAPSERKYPNEFDGTGPYLLEGYRENGTANLRKHSDDWHGQRGYFERVKLTAVPDAQRRHSAIMNTELDVAEDIDPRMLAMLSHMQDIEITEAKSNRHVRIELPEGGVFDDHGLRRALQQNIDRKGLLSRVFLGHGHLGADVPAGRDALDHGAVETSSHPSECQVPLPLTEPGSPLLKAVADDMQNAAQVIGFPLYFGVEDDVSARLSVSDEAGDSALICCGNGQTECQGLLEKAWGTQDDAAREVLKQKAFQAFTDDARLLVPVWINDLTAYRQSLARPAASDGSPDGVITQWWFK